MASYVLNGLAPLVGALEPLQNVSLFYHYAASNPLREGLAADHVGVLLGVAVIAGTLAPLAFDRRDLAA